MATAESHRTIPALAVSELLGVYAPDKHVVLQALAAIMPCLDQQGFAFACEVPQCTPRWVNGALLIETIVALSPISPAPLSVSDAVESILPVGRLADVLEVKA